MPLKTRLLTFCLLLFASWLSAQNPVVVTGVLPDQKDAWGVTYEYIGELKNGKPSGWGIARYENGSVKRYVGQFQNGFYNGRGVLLFTDSVFLAGQWKDGKLNGQGTNYNKNGSIYFGKFADGLKNGRGMLVYKNNDFFYGDFKADKANGRCISLWSNGTILSDIQYIDDQRNGYGYQYEANQKKLYSGQWAADKWVAAATPPFSSFLNVLGFIGEKTDKHILMGPVTDKGFLKDTSYYYDLEKHRRYFGRYENGHLTDGLIVRDDSTRFYGPLGGNGANGYAYDFKFGAYYSEGNYVNDLLNGQIIDVDLKKSSVYFGTAVNGSFTGKAVFFNNSNSMYNGDYKEGKFTGTGYRLTKEGTRIYGSWENGAIRNALSLSDAKGKSINLKPASLQEALTTILNDYPRSFETLVPDLFSGDESMFLSEDTAFQYLANYTLLKTPGAVKPDYAASDFFSNDFYAVVMAHTVDAAKAKALYLALAKQIGSMTLKPEGAAKPLRVSGTLQQPAGTNFKATTEYTIADLPVDYEGAKIYLSIVKFGGFYDVLIRVGLREQTIE